MSIRETLLKAESYLDEFKLRTKEQLGLFETFIVYPYRGYGNQQQAVLKGRVLEKKKIIHGDDGEDKGLFQNALRFVKRYESDELPGVSIKAVFNGQEEIATSDKDGFFEFWFDYSEAPAPGWHTISLQVIQSDYSVPIEKNATGEIFIPSPDAGFGIISDVDDTLIESNATNIIERLRTMASHTAKSRPVFDGACELYTELSGNYKNPIWFISGSSYNLHDLLKEICLHNDLPKAPFLLRDLGLDDSQWLKKDTAAYKKKHLSHILDMYPELNFILIGDSGQQDPEIYAETIEMFPDRILSVCIRHVDGDERKQEIHSLEEKMKVPLVLFSDSREVLEHLSKTGKY